MVIAVDIGNTNIVLGIFDNNNLRFIERISTDHNITSLEYALKFKSILDIHNINSKMITGSIISSVVPAVTQMTEAAIKRITGISPKIVGKGLETGLEICIDTPKQLGSDLVVDAVAVCDEYKCPAIIIDMGTATTFSVIDSKKRYIGGMILPGLNISLEALKSRTSQLPKIELSAPPDIIGKNTIDCMKSGMIYGTAAQIDAVIERISEELDEEPVVIATGGIAAAVIPLCKKKVIRDDALLLKGLIKIYNRNLEKTIWFIFKKFWRFLCLFQQRMFWILSRKMMLNL